MKFKEELQKYWGLTEEESRDPGEVPLTWRRERMKDPVFAREALSCIIQRTSIDVKGRRRSASGNILIMNMVPAKFRLKPYVNWEFHWDSYENSTSIRLPIWVGVAPEKMLKFYTYYASEHGLVIFNAIAMNPRREIQIIAAYPVTYVLWPFVYIYARCGVNCTEMIKDMTRGVHSRAREFFFQEEILQKLHSL